MIKALEYQSDIDEILSHRYDQGADFWTTPDRRLLKGAPFSAYESALFLLELGVGSDDPMLKGIALLFFEAWQQDGRFKLYPTGAVYPCHTIHAVHLLCMLGYSQDERVQKTLAHLLKTRHADGGWRCNKFSFGRGPETEFSNPFPTLMALNAFRLSGCREPSLDKAVDFLLGHWETRKPIGPCHYGIGTRFMQVEYPFRGYNLFFFVYVLSFYERARRDGRFLEAYNMLKAKTADGQIIVERVVPKLANLAFCKKGQRSALATRRYKQICMPDGIV